MVEYNVSLEGKTVLVTGAAGFIGSNLVKRLFQDIKEIKVIGIDSMTDYYDVNIKKERLSEIEGLNRDWWSIWYMLRHRRYMAQIRKCHIQRRIRWIIRSVCMLPPRKARS